MSGRCPNCGKVIDPPQRAPAAPSASFGSDEPLGLVPIEEEWPEPAQLEGVDERLQYDFGSVPSQWAEPEPHKPPELEGYGLEGVPRSASPMSSTSQSLTETYSVSHHAAPPEAIPVEPETLSEAYPVHLPHAGPASARSREIARQAIQATPPATPFEDSGRATPLPVATPVVEEKKGPEKIPPLPLLPPSRPLMEGVYTFPWHLGSLKAWIIAGLQLAILGLLTCFLINLGRYGPILIPALGVIGLVAGAFAAANFAAVVEDSAWGNDSFTAPEWFGERLGYLLHLIYIGFCSLIPTFFIGGAVSAHLANLDSDSKWGALAVANLGVLAALVPSFLVFPIFYLSSLAAKSRVIILDRRVIGGFLRNPRSSLVLFFVSLILGSICYELAWLLFAVLHWSFFLGVFFGLAAGLIWSACMLIYARLLGRVAFVISGSGVRVKRRKKRRKKPAPGPDDWGGEVESKPAEKPVSP
jgi:hypothetical protein